MAMTLSEAIKGLKIISAYRESKEQIEESKEAYQLMNWLIELKNFKKEEKKKINFLEEIIKAKDLEIKKLKSKLSEFDDDSYTDSINLKENVIMDKKVYLDGKFDGTIYKMKRATFKERAVPMDRVIVKDKVIKEKPKMKCEVLDSKYSHRLRQAIQCFLEENKIEEVISLSCYFDSSTDYHVAVIIYK